MSTFDQKQANHTNKQNQKETNVTKQTQKETNVTKQNQKETNVKKCLNFYLSTDIGQSDLDTH